MHKAAPHYQTWWLIQNQFPIEIVYLYGFLVFNSFHSTPGFIVFESCHPLSLLFDRIKDYSRFPFGRNHVILFVWLKMNLLIQLSDKHELNPDKTISMVQIDIQKPRPTSPFMFIFRVCMRVCALLSAAIQFFFFWYLFFFFSSGPTFPSLRRHNEIFYSFE